MLHGIDESQAILLYIQNGMLKLGLDTITVICDKKKRNLKAANDSDKQMSYSKTSFFFSAGKLNI